MADATEYMSKNQVREALERAVQTVNSQGQAITVMRAALFVMMEKQEDKSVTFTEEDQQRSEKAVIESRFDAATSSLTLFLKPPQEEGVNQPLSQIVLDGK